MTFAEELAALPALLRIGSPNRCHAAFVRLPTEPLEKLVPGHSAPETGNGSLAAWRNANSAFDEELKQIRRERNHDRSFARKWRPTASGLTMTHRRNANSAFDEELVAKNVDGQSIPIH